tara:strand:- start:9 stop:326 length:318 start_codon:yes stop_codon:yes gene_type:complete
MAEERQNHFGTGYGSSPRSAKSNAEANWRATKPQGWQATGRFMVTSEFEDRERPMNQRWEVTVMKPIKRKAHEQTNADSPTQPGAAGIDSVITDGRVNGSELERT